MAYPSDFVPSSPTNANALAVVYGIDDSLPNYILQDVTVSKDINSIQIPDQKGAIAQIRDMQKHWAVSFTAIGPEPTASNFPVVGNSYTFGSVTGMVMSVEKRSTYNDTAKWSVTLDCYEGASYGPLTPSNG